MNIRIVAFFGVTMVLFAAGCGGQGGDSATSERERYVADICEPFARYFEGAIQLGFPEFEATSFDDFPSLVRQLKANAQASHDGYVAVTPPEDMRETHEQVIEVLEIEIGAYQLIETALESGSQELIDQAIREGAQLGALAGIGPTGFIPADVPPGYEEAWNEVCVPRLEQIAGL